MKIKTAIIVDNLSLSKWQKDALEEVKKKINIKLILNCQNSKTKKKIFKNLFYYILNIISLRNFLSIKKKFFYPKIKTIHFNSVYNGSWQALPANVIDKLNNEKIQVVIKFGMNLLKIEDNLSNLSVLSFHHGNPSKYRGRPAGFYEILNNEKKLGIIVQRLTNNLDAGTILAFAESKVVNFSYKKTSINYYSNSRYLLSKAIDNLLEKKEIKIKKNGKIYKLPSNLIVLKFIFVVMINFYHRIIYGLFYEKKWKVAITKNKLSFNVNKSITSNGLIEVPIEKKYNFYADPFFSFDNKSIRIEALNKFTGLGELLDVSILNLKDQKLLLSKKHYSYPLSFVFKNEEYILPEVASHSPQYFFSLRKDLKKKYFIKGLENNRLIDATIVEHQKNWYLFFGNQNNASTVLNLWVSKSPFSKFKVHPRSPIVLSPSLARMGGSILRLNNDLFRFGQNNEGEYGESISALKIDKLTPKEYSEKLIGSLKMENYKGPHTININQNKKLIAFDYYSNKFSFFAGIRRVIGKLNF